jgi:PAS domain S-box-containing protein
MNSQAASEAFYAALLDDDPEQLYERAPCGYLTTTPDGIVVKTNATFESLTGYTREELVGRQTFAELLSPGGRIYHETHYAPMLRMQGTVREVAFEIVRSDGEHLPVLVNSVLVHGEDGTPLGVRTVVLDARERRAYERELLAARDRERRAREEIERRHEASRTIAHTLQQSMLAGAPPDDRRFTVASLYRPAVPGLEVGGDWHDVFRLPGDRAGVVVGDVVGRGLPAASAMGQLRSAVRALAGAGHSPEAVLRHLDTFVEETPAAQYATLVYAEVDPATGTVVLAAAGHLPPVLFGGGEPRLFDGGRSTPLGIAVVPRTEATFTLAPGEGFVFYTDGLVERRRESIDAGLGRLLALTHPAVTPAELVGALLDGDAGDDDVCVLVFRRTYAP